MQSKTFLHDLTQFQLRVTFIPVVDDNLLYPIASENDDSGIGGDFGNSGGGDDDDS